MVDVVVIIAISAGVFVLCVACAVGAYYFGKLYGFSKLLFGEEDKKPAGGERAPRGDAKPAEAKGGAPKPAASADSSSDSDESTDNSLADYDLLPNNPKQLAKYRTKLTEYQQGKGKQIPSNIPSKAAKLLGADEGKGGRGGAREEKKGGGGRSDRDDKGSGREEKKGGGRSDRDEKKGGGRDEGRGGGRDEGRGGGRGGGRDEGRGGRDDGRGGNDLRGKLLPRKYSMDSEADMSYDEENPRRPPPRGGRRDDDRGPSRGGGRDDGRGGGRDDDRRGGRGDGRGGNRSPPRTRGRDASPRRDRDVTKTIDNGSLESVGSVGSMDGTLTASSFFTSSRTDRRDR